MIFDIIFAIGMVGGLFGIGSLSVVVCQDAKLCSKINPVLADIFCYLIVATIVIHVISDFSVKKNISVIPSLALMLSLTLDSTDLPSITLMQVFTDLLLTSLTILATGHGYKLVIDKLLGIKTIREVEKEDEC